MTDDERINKQSVLEAMTAKRERIDAECKRIADELALDAAERIKAAGL